MKGSDNQEVKLEAAFRQWYLYSSIQDKHEKIGEWEAIIVKTNTNRLDRKPNAFNYCLRSSYQPWYLFIFFIRVFKNEIFTSFSSQNENDVACFMYYDCPKYYI